MKFRSHRGGVYYTPENTMPAFERAMTEGFVSLETDPCFTKDGVIVLMHDITINRTCRMPDGSPIEKTVKVSDITYNELMKYDAGIANDIKFKGTKVPTLEELLKLVEGSDVSISLDKRIPTDDMDPLLDLVAKYNTRVSFSCGDVERIKKVQSRFPDAMIDYDGQTLDEQLAEITSLVKPENLLVWLYLDTPNFAWLKDRAKTSPENCARVKRYARLAIGNVNNAYDVKEALGFDPDVIEV